MQRIITTILISMLCFGSIGAGCSEDDLGYGIKVGRDRLGPYRLRYTEVYSRPVRWIQVDVPFVGYASISSPKLRICGKRINRKSNRVVRRAEKGSLDGNVTTWIVPDVMIYCGSKSLWISIIYKNGSIIPIRTKEKIIYSPPAQVIGRRWDMEHAPNKPRRIPNNPSEWAECISLSDGKLSNSKFCDQGMPIFRIQVQDLEGNPYR